MIEIAVLLVAAVTFLSGIYSSDRMHSAALEHPDSWLSYVLNTIDKILKTKRTTQNTETSNKQKGNTDGADIHLSESPKSVAHKGEIFYVDLRRYNRPEVAKRIFTARYLYVFFYIGFFALSVGAVISRILSGNYFNGFMLLILCIAFAYWMYYRVNALYVIGYNVMSESWIRDLVVVISSDEMYITKGGVSIIPNTSGTFNVVDERGVYELNYTGDEGKYTLLRYHQSYLFRVGRRPNLSEISTTLNGMLQRSRLSTLNDSIISSDHGITELR